MSAVVCYPTQSLAYNPDLDISSEMVLPPVSELFFMAKLVNMNISFFN